MITVDHEVFPMTTPFTAPWLSRMARDSSSIRHDLTQAHVQNSDFWFRPSTLDTGAQGKKLSSRNWWTSSNLFVVTCLILNFSVSVIFCCYCSLSWYWLPAEPCNGHGSILVEKALESQPFFEHYKDCQRLKLPTFIEHWRKLHLILFNW